MLDSLDHGKVLLLDGVIQLFERDEFIYHEMIAHVPMFCHPCAEKILVIGGGDGGTVREVLKHPTVEKVVMVEIDSQVVDTSRRFMPNVGTAFDDPRLEVVFEDGFKYIAEIDETFDIVIVDSSDAQGPAEVLYQAAFYENVSKRLNHNGILVTQAESPIYDHDIQIPMLEDQQRYFNRVHLYFFPTLSYPGAIWSFGFAAQNVCPLADFNDESVFNSDIVTRYYTPSIHRAAFILPPFLEKAYQDVLTPTGSGENQKPAPG